VLRAVSIAPSRRRGSLRSCSSISAGQSSASSSGSVSVPGPGYISGKVLKWLGVTAICALEDAIIMKRANGHISLLKRWEKEDSLKIGTEERVKLFGMLGDALEMSLSDLVYFSLADLTSIRQALLSSACQQDCLRHRPRGATLASFISGYPTHERERCIVRPDTNMPPATVRCLHRPASILS